MFATILQQNPALQLTLAIFSFVLGSCVGSFLNVVIYRLPNRMSVSNPKRSFCPSCKYQIPYWHNIPIFSWLFLRGRCANCGSGISPRYFFVEVLTGFLFLITFLWFRDTPWVVMPYWIFLSIALSATYIDFDHYEIPDQLSLGGTAAGLVCSVVFPWLLVPNEGRLVNLMWSGVGALSGAAIVWVIVELGKIFFGRLKLEFAESTDFKISQADEESEPILDVGGKQYGWFDFIFSRESDKLKITCQALDLGTTTHGPGELVLKVNSLQFTPAGGGEVVKHDTLENVPLIAGKTTKLIVPREAMGLGDVKFMAAVGAFLGWKGVLFTLLAGSVAGAAVAMILILFRKREWAGRIPFGPYLALGAAVFMFVGGDVIRWYWTLSFPVQ